MATKPTPGGSDGTYGTELNAFLDVSLDSDGKVINEALQTASTAPSADAALANKKYVDDQITSNADPAYSGGESHTFNGGLIIKAGEESVLGTATDDITYGAAFGTAVISSVCSYKSSTNDITGIAVCKPKVGEETAKLQVTNGSNQTRTISWIVVGH